LAINNNTIANKKDGNKSDSNADVVGNWICTKNGN
jgi:hypothetical protein